MIPAYVKIIRNTIARNNNEFLQVSILSKFDKFFYSSFLYDSLLNKKLYEGPNLCLKSRPIDISKSYLPI